MSVGKPDPILVVPTVEKGRGGGHLARCADLVRSLRLLGRDAYLYLPSDFSDSPSSDLLLPVDRSPESLPWNFIVLDLFRPDVDTLRRFSALAPLVGIDAGGPAKDSLDYLLDLLPGLPGRSSPNEVCPFLLFRPAARRSSFAPPTASRTPKVLVSFGAEDSAGLSVPAALSLAAAKAFEVEILFGPRNPGPTESERAALDGAPVRILASAENLRERPAEYDLIVTHFGLTAFEALGARVPVLLVSPTVYHHRLAVAAGLPSAGIGRAAARRLGRRLGRRFSFRGARSRGAEAALAEIGRLSAAAADRYGPASATPAAQPAPVTPATAAQAAPAEPASLAARIAPWTFPSRARCPLCGALPPVASRSLARFPGRTYRRCRECGMVHMVRPDDPPIEYGRDYFFADYKRQYGKTYLEDFSKLQAMGAARVSRIRAQLGPSPAERPPRLLDVGCAYGPFLAAARGAGFACAGIDPAEDAVRYVSDTLGIPAVQGLFPEVLQSSAYAELFGSPAAGSLDAVSLWYVIEHFADVGAALSAAAGLLRVGGVLAFSTPSLSGISGRTRRRDFLEKSPQDHWTLWEVGRTAELLRRFGFTLAQTHVTGHHPERFPLVGNWAARRKGLAFRGLAGLSMAFGLGDTFEAYAVKTEDRG